MTSAMELNHQNSHEHNRQHIAYLCMPSNELRGANKVSEQTCHQWAVRSSSKDIFHMNGRIQGKCPNCPNRPRIDPASARVFSTKDEAKLYCEIANTPVVLEPNTTKLIEDEKDEWFE
jgi:hypothetical protein